MSGNIPAYPRARYKTTANYENSSGIAVAQTEVIAYARDNGLGDLATLSATCGTVNYAAGTLNLEPAVATRATVSVYSNEEVGSGYEGTLVQNGATSTRKVTDTDFVEVTADFPASGGVVTVNYLVVDADHAASEAVELDTLTFDLTRGYKETIVAGSVRFALGASVYVDTAGQIYRDPSALTGAGSLAGSLDRSTGQVTLVSWPEGGSNTVTLESLTTAVGTRLIDIAVFRTPIAPIKSGTLQVRFVLADGTAKTKSVDGTGVLEDTDCTIRVDYPTGVVRARFGLWKVDADLTPEEKLEPWYDADLRVDFNGTLKIWKPALIYADSLLYNAVATTFLPPDSALIGLNAARMPPDGRALIFNAGRLVLIHHTDTHTENSLSPTQSVDMGRVRLYRVTIEDTDGQRLPASFYSVDRATGIVTMASDLNLTGYTGPYLFSHTVADLVRLVDVDINGTLTSNKALSHDFPADDSYASGLLYVGTLQARVTALFAQSAWTSVWQDTVIGDPPLAQYNDVLYPPTISNLGAYPDRFVLRFTSSTAFGCYGENLGYLGAGTINENFAPTNALSGQPYFTLDYRGWGGGWSTGNCLRFNLIGANYPTDLIRAIQPSEPTGQDDSVELLFLGNVDA